MAKKKKAALKPAANRGFATTSTPSKRPTEGESGAGGADAAQENGEAAEDSSSGADGGENHGGSLAEKGSGGQGSAARDKRSAMQTDSKFSAEDEDEQALQNIVNRLAERVEKDVARFWKTIEFERRLARQLPIFEMEAAMQKQILEGSGITQLGDGEMDTFKAASSSDPHEISSLLDELSPNSSASALLQKALVTHALLLRLGFTTAHATAALKESQDAADVDECVSWLVSALDAAELEAAEQRCEGKATLQDGEQGSSDYASQLDDSRPPHHDGFTFQRQHGSSTSGGSAQGSTPKSADGSGSQTPVELPQRTLNMAATFKARAAQLLEVLEDQDKTDTLEDPNDSYAKARLFVIQVDKSGGILDRATKGVPSNASTLLSESRRKMLALKTAARKVIDECQASPGWVPAAGEASFQRLKMEWEDEESKKPDEQLQDKQDKQDNSSEEADAAGVEPSAGSQLNANGKAVDDDKSDGEEDMFGGLLNEQANEVQDIATSNTVRLRELPPQVVKAQGSRTPRAHLADMLRRNHPSASARFEPVATGGRLFRSRLILRWMVHGRSVTDKYCMTSIATLSQGSADDLMAIAALLCVDTRSVYKTLGSGWREWWDELAEHRQDERDADNRRHFRGILEALRDHLLEENTMAQGSTQKQIGTSLKPKDNGNQNEPAHDTGGIDTDITVQKGNLSGKELWDKKESSPAYARMLPGRQNLPIAAYKEHVLGILAQNQVLVLSGETGCGKSTQVPAFILEESLKNGKACKIYVTEPRRISAISLAERVSQELGEPRGTVGKGDSLVGSSVRLESSIGRSTCLIYATTGIVLRMLEGSRLEGITHIIVDEVHERSIESDFLLIILKSLMTARKDLKVVLMSATLDAERISAYFGGCPTINVPGRTYPVDVQWLEDAVELCDYTLEDGSQYARRFNRRSAPQDNKARLASAEDEAPDEDADEEDQEQSKIGGAGRYKPKTISTLDRMDEYIINHDLIVVLLEKMCFGPQDLQVYSAAILIFLPGLADIRKLHDLLQAHRDFGTKAFQIFPLHSSITSEDQSLVFEMPPRGVRKVVISTNIAETGITIPDITCVIDSGKHREMRFDEKRQMSKLIECFVARSNAKQRRGRAGRVQNGMCWHLFTRYRHDQYLAEHPIPEMLRLSLQDLALKLKVMKVRIGTSIEDSLSKALDAPSPTNIQRAVASLVEIKALTTTEDITALGRQLSRLPLDVHMGKFLLVACTLRVLDSALTIAATLNAKSPFLTPFGRELEARAAKKSFDAGNSDFVAAVRAFNAWRRATENNAARQFCQKCFLSQTNLIQIEELRQQYMTYLLDAGFVNVDDKTRREVVSGRFRFQAAKTRFMRVPAQFDTNSSSQAMLHAALGAALYPKLLVLDARNGALRTLTNNAPASIHPSSVNFKTRLDQLPRGIHHLVYYTIMQSRRLFAWETGAIDNRALLLLCGEADFKFSARSLYIDRQRLRVTFYDLKVLLAIKVIRQRLVRALQASFRNPGKSPAEEDIRCLALASKYLGVGANEKDLVVI